MAHAYSHPKTPNNLKVDPLEIQHQKFENSRRGLIESVHETRLGNGQLVRRRRTIDAQVDQFR